MARAKKPQHGGRRKGAGRKPTGAALEKVLFIRCAPDLLAALDAYAESQRTPGRACSRSDAARELLWRGLRVTPPK